MTPEQIYARNALRLEFIEADVQMQSLLQIPIQYRNETKIEALERQMYQLEAQISAIGESNAHCDR